MYPDFSFAHLGINVVDTKKIVVWYLENLACQAIRPPQGGMVFLTDPTGRVIFEIYSKPNADTLPFGDISSDAFHIAFLIEDPSAAAKKLEAQGAEITVPLRTNDKGDQLITLKDPFGISLQLIKRVQYQF